MSISDDAVVIVCMEDEGVCKTLPITNGPLVRDDFVTLRYLLIL